MFPSLSICNNFFLGYFLYSDAGDFVTKAMHMITKMPLLRARYTINDTGMTSDQYLYMIGFWSSFDTIFRLPLRNYFGSSMIVDAQWYFWDLLKPQPGVNWTDTIVADPVYVRCHSIDLSEEHSTVSWYL